MGFLVGVIVGWLAYRFALTTGARLFSQDKDASRQVLDRLTYTGLVNLRDATDSEIARRRGPE